MDPTLLLIGSGEPACETARLAREAGLFVVATEADPRSALRRWAHRFHALDAKDLVALTGLAEELRGTAPLAGVHAVGDGGLLAAATLAELTTTPTAPLRAVEALLATSPTASDAPPELAANAFFRDGTCVLAGVFELHPAGGRLPAELSADDLRAIHGLLSREAGALDIDVGPLSARIARSADGLALVGLRPRFLPEVATAHASRLAYGKSPLQAHFADLAGAGGPFDEMPLEPRACAGWREIAAEERGVAHVVPEAERVLRLPGVRGIAVHNLPGRRTRAQVWAEGATPSEVDERLLAALEALQLRPALTAVA